MMNKDVTKISQKLASELVSKENRKDICQKLGVSNSYITLLLKGNRTISNEVCDRLKKTYPDLEPICISLQLKKAGF